MSKSDYLERALLDHVFGGPDLTRPATVHVALTLSTPVDSDTGADLNEPAAPSYVRLAVANDATQFPAAGGDPSLKTNGEPWMFPVAEENWDSGPLVGWAICDASTGGNVLYHGEFPAERQRAILEGDQAFVAAGSLSITED